MSNRILMTGNEAVARGVWEAGASIVVAYPGTPSTEITENAAKYAEIEAQWAPNEKVALEVAMGAGIAGGRALCAMKHVGVNVAADPLFTAAYTGTNGGVVLVSADDPGMHSSQNEQDNRHYARAAKVPILEPSDSAEAKDFTKQAFEISERFDTPVMLRLTTRVAHSQSLVEQGERQEFTTKEYQKDVAKYVMIPANARKRHVVVEQRLLELAAYSDSCGLNKIVWGSDKKMGIIASGAVYEYVREALPEVAVLKIGMSYPLPQKMIQNFAAEVEQLIVIEELEPFIEQQVKSWGIKCAGRELFSNLGELFTEQIAHVLGGAAAPFAGEAADVPVRPPVLCPGCPHRGTFYVLKQMRLVVSGDIGCYTLGCLSPLNAIDTTLCMGYSVSGLHGMELAQGREFAKKSVAVIGDSTFIHSGVTGVINAVYNQGTSTILILDNSITAMTGHQENPCTGKDAKGRPAPAINLEALCRACGVQRVRVADPFDLKGLRMAIKEELAADEVSVIIVRRPCILLDKSLVSAALSVDATKCANCANCMRIGCPAILQLDTHVQIDTAQCVGCGLCMSMCNFGAIAKGDN